MELTKMKAKQLAQWVAKLERLVRIEDDKRNKAIYTKWLNDARLEQQQRYERKRHYLDNVKRSMYD